MSRYTAGFKKLVTACQDDSIDSSEVYKRLKFGCESPFKKPNLEISYSRVPQYTL